jgi:hypothetical protein
MFVAMILPDLACPPGRLRGEIGIGQVIGLFRDTPCWDSLQQSRRAELILGLRSQQIEDGVVIFDLVV